MIRYTSVAEWVVGIVPLLVRLKNVSKIHTTQQIISNLIEISRRRITRYHTKGGYFFKTFTIPLLAQRGNSQQASVKHIVSNILKPKFSSHAVLFSLALAYEAAMLQQEWHHVRCPTLYKIDAIENNYEFCMSYANFIVITTSFGRAPKLDETIVYIFFWSRVIVWW